MPEVAKIDSVVQMYQRDTVGKEYMSLLQTYQYKDSIFRDSATSRSSGSKRTNRKRISTVNTNTPKLAANSTGSCSEQTKPVIGSCNEKNTGRYQAVAKEKGYTYVVSRESVIVAPEADNLLQAVAKKLNVTVPPQLLPGYKPPVGGR